MHYSPRERNEGGHAVRRRLQFPQDGSDVGSIFSRGGIGIRIGAGRLVTGENVMHARKVCGIGVVQGADDGQFVGPLRHIRQQFGDVDSGDVGGDGFEFPPNFIGSVGLGVPCIDV